ncbi:GDSL-type esterase/lipase family protein [Catenovulum agarivorans]|uniref:GDSL-type esterase/lipase family protein n=1 Tax=Catenovulum agarivorans TaxID=1172192 RepID=UPI000308843D|nr:GDSL-type esterase/lipase family protein [Catenovulum agarivorans]
MELINNTVSPLNALSEKNDPDKGAALIGMDGATVAKLISMQSKTLEFNSITALKLKTTKRGIQVSDGNLATLHNEGAILKVDGKQFKLITDAEFNSNYLVDDDEYIIKIDNNYYAQNIDKPDDSTLLKKEIYTECFSVGAGSKYHATNWSEGNLGNGSTVITNNVSSGLLFDTSSASIFGDNVYFDAVLPYVVGIGDSIMQGRTALNSRLMQNGVKNYNPSQQSQSGQISYEVQQAFNVPFLNQGIGGQRTDEIWARWSRDVLAEVYDAGDGLGSETLQFNRQKPFAVWIHAGVNDIRQGYDVSHIATNLENMAQSCRANNIVCIVNNIGPATDHDATKQAKSRQVNNWLNNYLKKKYPEIYVIDFMYWASNGTNNPITLKPNMFADELHPNRDGYRDFSKYVFENYDLPLCLNQIEFDSAYDSSLLTNFARVTNISIDNVRYKLSKDKTKTKIALTGLSGLDNPVKRVGIYNRETISGAGEYMGFCSVKGVCSSANVASEQKENTASIVAAATITSGSLSTHPRVGVYTLDVGNVASGYITVNLIEKANWLDVRMVGTSDTPWNYYVTWSTGGHSGIKSWNIYLFDRATGAAVTDLQKFNVDFKAFA